MRSSPAARVLALAAAGLVAGALSAAQPAAAGGHRSGCTPAVFAPGVVSTGQNESRVAFTPDGRVAYFGRSDTPGALEDSALYETRRRHGGWSEPVRLPFTGEYDDLDPFVTRDGERLLFASTRPVGGESTGVNLWSVSRTWWGGWGEPHPLASVNTEYDELYPSIADDGTLYFNSNRPGSRNDFDLWQARPRPGGGYYPAENLGATVNSAPLQFNPAPLPGNSGVVFASIGRADAIGPIDLYLTLRTRSGWTEPRHLGAPISSENSEFHPSFSPTYDRMYFARTDPETGFADLYSVPTLCVFVT